MSSSRSAPANTGISLCSARESTSSAGSTAGGSGSPSPSLRGAPFFSSQRRFFSRYSRGLSRFICSFSRTKRALSSSSFVSSVWNFS